MIIQLDDQMKKVSNLADSWFEYLTSTSILMNWWNWNVAIPVLIEVRYLVHSPLFMYFIWQNTC